MYAVVKIGDKDVPMRAMASIDLYYRNIFHEDPIKLQTRPDFDDAARISFAMRMGFVMAKFAELPDRKAMNALNEDAFLDWMDQFERGECLEALVDITMVYEGQFGTDADAKKKDAEPSAS